MTQVDAFKSHCCTGRRLGNDFRPILNVSRREIPVKILHDFGTKEYSYRKSSINLQGGLFDVGHSRGELIRKRGAYSKR